MLIRLFRPVLGHFAASQHALATLGSTNDDRSHMIALLEPATFVLQRRIVRPFEHSQQTVANPAVFGSGSVMCDGPCGGLVLDGPFRRSSVDPSATWSAEATLQTPGGRLWAGRRIAAVEIEIGPWSATDTELL